MSRWMRKMSASRACLVLHSRNPTRQRGPEAMRRQRQGPARGDRVPCLLRRLLVLLESPSHIHRIFPLQRIIPRPLLRPSKSRLMLLLHGLLTLSVFLPRLPPTHRRHYNVTVPMSSNSIISRRDHSPLQPRPMEVALGLMEHRVQPAARLVIRLVVNCL